MTSVAVLIPAYNAEHVLDAALASVAGQTEPPSEVLVLDDASTDMTHEVAQRWSPMLPLRILQHSENLGPGAARSHLLGAADSDLCALLDADDCWLPQHLATLSSAWTQAGGLVTANAYCWHELTGLLSETYRDTVPVPEQEAQRRALLRRNFVFIGTLFDRQRALSVGGFRSDFVGAEDWDLWIRLVRDGVRVVPASPPTVIYRLSPTGLTSTGKVSAAAEELLAVVSQEADLIEERRWAERSLAGLRARRRFRSSAQDMRDGRLLESGKAAVAAGSDYLRSLALSRRAR